MRLGFLAHFYLRSLFRFIGWFHLSTNKLTTAENTCY